jgi:hypothetical protein
MVSTGHLSGAADFGARVGCSWREIDEQDTDFETISATCLRPVRLSDVPLGRWLDHPSDISQDLVRRPYFLSIGKLTSGCLLRRQ